MDIACDSLDDEANTPIEPALIFIDLVFLAKTNYQHSSCFMSKTGNQIDWPTKQICSPVSWCK